MVLVLRGIGEKSEKQDISKTDRCVPCKVKRSTNPSSMIFSSLKCVYYQS